MMRVVNYSPEVERRCLQDLMDIAVHTDERIQKAMLLLTTDCFYDPCLAQLFLIIKKCFNTEQPFGFIDVLSLIPRQDKDLHDSLTWAMDDYRNLPFSNYLEKDVAKLVTMSTIRKQVALMGTTLSDIEKCPDPFAAQTLITEKLTETIQIGYRESKDGISNFELAEAYYSGEVGTELIIPTTITKLNEALNGGIMAKSLITVAADAGVGKTGFSIYLLDSIARSQPGYQSLFFSLEMEAKHIWTRHVGIRGGMRFENLTDEERLLAIASSIEVPIKIYDCSICRSAADIDFIITQARIKAREKPMSVIVVDYLGLVQNKGHFERNDLKQADITTKLANLAIELNCVVIALSQINRGASNRGIDDRCPYPSDAADSSGSHRSSTLWIGIDRPELYKDDPNFANQFIVKCRKNRFGSNFELTLAFNDGTFKEVDETYFRKYAAPRNKNPEQMLFRKH
jgi:replicative DNA helicase